MLWRPWLVFRPCGQMPPEAAVCRWPWDMPGMDGARPSSRLGKDAEQDLDAVPGQHGRRMQPRPAASTRCGQTWRSVWSVGGGAHQSDDVALWVAEAGDAADPVDLSDRENGLGARLHGLVEDGLGVADFDVDGD